MFILKLEGNEFYDDQRGEFVYTKPIDLRLEHSLVSLSKWESRWKIPFLSAKGLTREQSLSYIECMTMNQNVDPLVYQSLTNSDIQKVNQYIEDPQTATTFHDWKNTPRNRETVTSELIYFWMAQYNIPFECQKWHLNRLLTLIRIASIKNAPPKKMSKREILSQNKSLNAARRAAMGSKG